MTGLTIHSGELFGEVYQTAPEIKCFAPGRVNLIGEHTDYNGGAVFPCALDLGTECAAGSRADSKLRFYSSNFEKDGIIEISLNDLKKTGSWVDYPIGVIKAFRSFGYELPHGADLAFIGDLPDGAGLSSSAALEVLTGTILRELYGFSVTPQELAFFGQFAENRFIGVNCGIMDQFASALGKKDNAILLDTGTLEYRYAPLPGKRASIIIVNSGVKHSLASSAYNERRRQCESALADINTVTSAASLCSLSVECFEKYKGSIRDALYQKRARHAVYENERANAAFEALSSGDLKRFGRLMNESHISLHDDYEVSCPELDLLAETAWSIEGVYGARMTGGGFGGCTVNLVASDKAEVFKAAVSNAYKEKYGITPAIYTVNAGEGARRIK